MRLQSSRPQPPRYHFKQRSAKQNRPPKRIAPILLLILIGLGLIAGLLLITFISRNQSVNNPNEGKESLLSTILDTDTPTHPITTTPVKTKEIIEKTKDQTPTQFLTQESVVLDTPASSTQIEPADLNLEELSQLMLNLVNSDRQANGLTPVAYDDFAAQVGQKHAEEMAAYNYLSHWNQAGQGPDIRYGLAGGTDMVMENVYSYYQRYDNGTAVPIYDWNKLVFDAQRSLMESPGHRKNILDPYHTHVGIGLAYDPTTGEFRIAQEFTNRYLELEPNATEVASGESLVIEGVLLPGVEDPMINLRYEPLPSSLTVDQLNQTSTYESPAVFIDSLQPSMVSQDKFQIEIPFWPGAKPGFYHVLIWVTINEAQVPAADVLVLLK